MTYIPKHRDLVVFISFGVILNMILLVCIILLSSQEGQEMMRRLLCISSMLRNGLIQFSYYLYICQEGVLNGLCSH